MSARVYQVKDVARLARLTVRALHHYDAIGLLVPSGRTEAGYRLYGEDDLLRLQQILVCRELGLPLERIKRMLDDPLFDRRKSLLEHREQLARRGRRIEEMIRSVDAALESLKGEAEMEPSRLFDGFDPSRHEQESRQRWGGTDAYKEAARRTREYSSEDWSRIKAENDELMEALAKKLARGAKANDGAVLDLAEQHRLHIDRWYYPCDHRMHVNLAEMYVADDRFAASFEKYGPGLAAFVAGAIRANAEREQDLA